VGNQCPPNARAVAGIVQRHDPRISLTLTREATGEPGANADAVAVFLILLQMNGLIDEAAYVRERLMSPPADEVLLLTVLGEVAATIGDWMRAHSMATLVLSTNPHNTRADYLQHGQLRIRQRVARQRDTRGQDRAEGPDNHPAAHQMLQQAR
jgi:hypothetical protein